MKKGAAVVDTLVNLLPVIIAGLVILLVVVPSVLTLLKNSANQGECQLSVLIRSLGKKYTFGLSEFDTKCKMSRITIAKEDIVPFLPTAKEEVQKFHAKVYDTEFKETQNGFYKWELERIVADKMKSCFARGWAGKINLDPTLFSDAGQGVFGKNVGEHLCLVCAKLDVDPAVQSMVRDEKNGGFLSIKPWLDANTQDGVSVSDFLYGGYVAGSETRPIELSVGNVMNVQEPTAVVFVAQRTQMPGKDVQSSGFVGLFPYAKLTSDLGYQETRKKGAGGEIITAVVSTLSLPPAMVPFVLAGQYGTSKLVDYVVPQDWQTEVGEAKCTTLIGV